MKERQSDAVKSSTIVQVTVTQCLSMESVLNSLRIHFLPERKRGTCYGKVSGWVAVTLYQNG